MWFWVAGGVAVAALVLVGWAAAGTGRDLAELQRVADLARERTGFAQQRLRSSAARLQQSAARLQQAAAGAQQGRAGDPAAPGSAAAGQRKRQAARWRPAGADVE